MSATIRILNAEKYLSLVSQRVPNLVTLDCTWYPTGKDGYEEYRAEHIAGARYFPFTEIKSESPYPHMLPNTYAEFVAGASKTGLKHDDLVVVYDQQSYLGAPRAAWLLETFKHPQVFLLDNYQHYKRLGGTLESGDSPKVPESVYSSGTDPKQISSWLKYEDILQLLESGDAAKYNLIDARNNARFTGKAAEPRPGVQSGHIPGSKNVAFSDVVGSDGHFKSETELSQVLDQAGVDPRKPSIVLCGSGVTACVVKAALDQAYGTSAEIYDGSWGEWGVRAPSDFVEKSV